VSFFDLLASRDIHLRAVLGEDVVYTPGVGAPVTVRGIFDAAYQDVPVGDPGVASSGPAVFLRLSDLPSDPRSDTGAKITRSAVVYLAHTVRADGLGGVIMLLHGVV
jgi:hypothetical protein